MLFPGGGVRHMFYLIFSHYYLKYFASDSIYLQAIA